MSLECGECGRNLRGGHDLLCARHPKGPEREAACQAVKAYAFAYADWQTLNVTAPASERDLRDKLKECDTGNPAASGVPFGMESGGCGSHDGPVRLRREVRRLSRRTGGGMRVLSLFSGMGLFDLGLERAGMEIVEQCEIDKDCLRVLEQHWPDVRRWTDVRDINAVGLADEADSSRQRAGSVAGEREHGGRSAGAVHVDLICGGFPCQDVSVAGKRAGLDGARSGLWFEFHRIVRELRPKYVLVENVPGLLSSNQGRDFGVILDGLGELGFAVSWAILDSQHFGVPQRRRRVFIVAGPGVERTEAVLALAEGCGGHSPQSRATREDAAREAGNGVAHARRARPNASLRPDSDTYAPMLSPTLDTNLGTKQWLGDQDVENYGLMMDALAVRTANTNANGHGVAEDVAHTLDGVNGQAVAFDYQNSSTSDLVGTLHDQTGRGNMGGSGFGVVGASVRRLTPTECLRLQGAPDDWLDLAPPLSDGAKYRMAGNAVTVPVIEWIGRRLMAMEAE